MIEIKFYGLDSFSREVYVTQLGSYVVVVDDKFYSKANNDPDGEPLSRLSSCKLKIVEKFSNNNNNES